MASVNIVLYKCRCVIIIVGDSVVAEEWLIAIDFRLRLFYRLAELL